jgi:glycerophosphoryl diester phosphodiesterase
LHYRKLKNDRQRFYQWKQREVDLPGKYRSLVSDGADIIEADLGIEAGAALQSLMPTRSSKRIYFK